MSQKTTSGLRTFFSGEPFERFVAILIALVTLLAAIVGLLEVNARTQADQASRNAQQFAIQAMGREVSGATQVAFDWTDAYQSWNELDTLALSAENNGDAEASVRFENIRDRIAQLSPLLNAPYFDPADEGGPNIAGYEADLYLVEATTLAERYLASSELDNAWGDKANTYVAHLTMLAVTLFLFGLSTTIAGRVRWFFVGTGLFITSLTFIWMSIVLIRPVPALPDQAILDYARGVGATHRGEPEGAVEAFDQALALAPEYATVLYERGNVHYNLGDYDLAAADYEAAQAAGRDDINVAWNLGWTYYLLGRFDDAARMDRQALALDAEQIGVNFNLALALLAAGQIEAGQAEFAKALAIAQRQVVEAREAGLEPPSSLWWYLDAAARDLDSLRDRLTDQPAPWTEAPPRESIVDHDAVEAAVEVLGKQLRDLTVALEYTGQPPTGLVTARVSPLGFGQAIYDDNGDFVDYDVAASFPYGADEVLVLFNYEGMRDGQDVLWKVYRDGVEDPSFRLVEEWELGQTGEAEKALSFAYSNVFIFSPGEYVVEMYVDSHLVQQGGFTIEEP